MNCGGVQDMASIQRPAKLQPGALLTDVIWGDPTLEPLDEGVVHACIHGPLRICSDIMCTAKRLDLLRRSVYRSL